LTCRHFGAAEAAQAGFASRLVSPERAIDAARELALGLAAKPHGALTRSKQQFKAALAGAPSGAADADLIVSALAEAGRTALGG
jgi:enoyl-CoA hydratase/carnithine racemase